MKQKHRKMKKVRIITLGLAGLMMTFTACEKDEEGVSDVEALELESDASSEDTFESIDQSVEGGLASLDASARMDEGDPTAVLADCVIVTHDVENQTITLDFGEGCEDRHGNIRKGKIFIEYNDRKYVPGAYRIITFIDFFFNEIGVEGTRTITNTSSIDDEFEFTVTLVGGKLDFGDRGIITRDAEWVRTWFVGEGKVSRSGSAEGLVFEKNYSVTVDTSTPLLFLRECGHGLPVAGVKEIVVGDRSATINYGDGGCDRMVAVTVDGETFIREISKRKGFRN